MQIWSTNSGWFQLFKFEQPALENTKEDKTEDKKGAKTTNNNPGHFINFRNGKALDVSGGKDEEGRPVIVWNKHNGANQKWRVVYLDEAEKEPTKGLHEDFGFHINRPFYLKSRMLFGRVAELVGASNIVLKRYVKGRTEQ
jgi:hypothetical protein